MSESFPVAVPEKKVDAVAGLDIDLDALEPKADATVPPELQSRRKGGERKEDLLGKEEQRLYGYQQLAQAYAELGEMAKDVKVNDKQLLPLDVRTWIGERAKILSRLAYYSEYDANPESALSNAKNDLEQAVRRGVCQERQDNFASLMNTSIRKIQELTAPKVGFTPDKEEGQTTPEQVRIQELLSQFSESKPMPRAGESRDEAVASPQFVPKKGLLARARELFQ